MHMAVSELVGYSVATIAQCEFSFTDPFHL